MSQGMGCSRGGVASGMVVALWIVNSLLALGALAVGGLKLVRSKAQLKGAGMDWTDDFSPAAIKTIGALEVLGAIGLILPLATGILPILSPIAAVALVVLWIGAAVTHARRKEPLSASAPSLVLAVLAVVSAVLGFLVVLG